MYVEGKHGARKVEREISSWDIAPYAFTFVLSFYGISRRNEDQDYKEASKNIKKINFLQ